MHQKWGFRSALAVLAVSAISLSACGGSGIDDFSSSSSGSRSGGSTYRGSGNSGGGGGTYGGGAASGGGGGQNLGPDLTSGQENALSTAEDYISMSGFSRTGLIEQLKFEGYSSKNAAFAVDYMNVDWNKQATRSAEAYLSMSDFSRSGLIEQLEFEGYTGQQAAHGANKALGGRGGGSGSAGAGLTAGMENALGTAEDYISMSGFSRSGLIEQLKFEGYSSKDATFAVDNLRINWNEQAARTAKDYVSMSGFSRSALIEQLMFEGYTAEQAEYGANKAL